VPAFRVFLLLIFLNNVHRAQRTQPQSRSLFLCSRLCRLCWLWELAFSDFVLPHPLQRLHAVSRLPATLKFVVLASVTRGVALTIAKK
jgi:hypothetical protein